MNKEVLLYKYMSRLYVAKLRLQAEPHPVNALSFGITMVNATNRLRIKMNGELQQHTIGGK